MRITLLAGNFCQTFIAEAALLRGNREDRAAAIDYDKLFKACLS